MNIRELNGKTACMLGYGREGKAVVSALEKYAPECEVTIADANASIEIPNDAHWKQLGEGWLENLHKFDVVLASPGIPPRELPTDIAITNSTQLFLDSINQHATVIGVTGSKGKSTTASLLHAILKEAGKNALLLGNIGDAAIAHLSDVTPETIVVLEMSSYQLMRVTRSPQIAVVTSFFPEHLDYHGSLDAYKEAKTHITKFQSKDDTTFYFGASEGAEAIASASPGTKVAYTEEDAPIAVQDTQLIGTHNLFNIAGAAAVCRHLGVTDEVIISAAKSFRGLPHRLYDLGIHSGIHWVDDAISTTPESTIAALHALTPNVKAIIVGGQDRGNNFTQLGAVLSSCNVEHVILMGESGPRIGDAITDARIAMHTANSMEDAVSIAKSVLKTAEIAPICLLSPASPSYGMYRNFEEKGQVFQNAIET